MAIRWVVVFVIAGVFLFTSSRYKLSLTHASLMANHVLRCKKSLVQPVLAYLMQGLTSFVTDGKFFGSPYLLQLWMEANFTALI